MGTFLRHSIETKSVVISLPYALTFRDFYVKFRKFSWAFPKTPYRVGITAPLYTPRHQTPNPKSL